MGQRIEKDGKFYRMRRGKLVEIPPEWRGRTVSKQTIRNRPSKMLHKHRKDEKHPNRYSKERREIGRRGRDSREEMAER